MTSIRKVFDYIFFGGFAIVFLWFLFSSVVNLLRGELKLAASQFLLSIILAMLELIICLFCRGYTRDN